MENELSSESISYGLNTDFIGQHIQYFPRLNSTMDTARESALSGVSEGTMVLAKEQTAGRGRLGRRWISPRGCLTFSLILYPETGHLAGLVMVAALAVREAAMAFIPVVVEIKWPNDVLVGGKKICGILVETGRQVGGRHYAVVGIGLNVNLNMTAYPELEAATSLSAEAGRDLSYTEVMHLLLARFEYWYKALHNGGPVFENWRACLTTLGKEVRILAGGGCYEGIAEDVAQDGSLLLRLQDGQLMKMPVGDVTLKAFGADSLYSG